jgi:hypothetical protein
MGGELDEVDLQPDFGLLRFLISHAPSTQLWFDRANHLALVGVVQLSQRSGIHDAAFSHRSVRIVSVLAVLQESRSLLDRRSKPDFHSSNETIVVALPAYRCSRSKHRGLIGARLTEALALVLHYPKAGATLVGDHLA